MERRHYECVNKEGFLTSREALPKSGCWPRSSLLAHAFSSPVALRTGHCPRGSAAGAKLCWMRRSAVVKRLCQVWLVFGSRLVVFLFSPSPSRLVASPSPSITSNCPCPIDTLELMTTMPSLPTGQGGDALCQPTSMGTLCVQPNSSPPQVVSLLVHCTVHVLHPARLAGRRPSSPSFPPTRQLACAVSRRSAQAISTSGLPIVPCRNSR